MDMQPLVSIVTPSFNQKEFIRNTIESVLSQDYDNIEYIVVDGGSKDGTLDIFKEYEDSLKYISEKDNGQSDAINKGFRMAKGSIVAWLNSDDVYEPGCVSRAVTEFEKNNNLALVYGEGYIIDREGNRLKRFEATQEFDYWKLINFWDYIMQPATFFSAKKLLEAGYLDISLNWCMDWDLWIRLASVGEVKYVNEFFADSREYGDTKTMTGGLKRLNEIKTVMRKYSRSRNPLGIKSYSSSTLYMSMVGRGKLEQYAARNLTRVHDKLFRQIPEKYPDTWIGKEFKMVIPDYNDKVRLIIDVPEPSLWTQKILIKYNKKIIEELIINDAEKRVVEIDNTDKNYSEICVICKKDNHFPGDNRVLSARIEVETE